MNKHAARLSVALVIACTWTGVSAGSTPSILRRPSEAGQRVTPDPQGLQNNGLANIPPVNGAITIPTLSMHTLGDLFVPFSMEQIYKRRAGDNGASGLLVLRAYRDPRQRWNVGRVLLDAAPAVECRPGPFDPTPAVECM